MPLTAQKCKTKHTQPKHNMQCTKHNTHTTKTQYTIHIVKTQYTKHNTQNTIYNTQNATHATKTQYTIHTTKTQHTHNLNTLHQTNMLISY